MSDNGIVTEEIVLVPVEVVSVVEYISYDTCVMSCVFLVLVPLFVVLLNCMRRSEPRSSPIIEAVPVSDKHLISISKSGS